MEGIVVRDLKKTYHVTGMPPFPALKGVSLTLQRKECLALTGKSGSGKSTIARMITGLERPDAGEVLIDDVRVDLLSAKKWRPFRSVVQAVFQDASGTLNPGLSVYRNTEMAMKNLTPLTGKERKERILELMALARMEEAILQHPVSALSGGEQRRIALVRALSVRPSYLVLDEVTSGLDRVNAERVLETLKTFLKAFSCGCLLITHDRFAADALADRIFVIDEGRLIREGVR